ncbi:MAG: CHASE2 domain-containing protein [Cyanobacteria bacterium SID2]|nr:CHASE2 domain-containing protein [Cyanobacteria bacterium SID2]MBP0006721.1 CHASE2 domain-containing protein [Cyanobacteria bacterium SBC]
MWQTFKLAVRQWSDIFIIAPSVAAFVIGCSLTGGFQLLEWAALDLFFRLRPLEPIDPRIAIVSIDDSDIAYFKQWPMSDAQLANAIEAIRQHQPRAIGLDLYRDLPVEPGHHQWIQTMQTTPNLIGIEKVNGNPVPAPTILGQLDRVGVADLISDADGKVRRALLSVRPQDERTRLSFGVKLALMYLEDEGIVLESIDVDRQQYRLGKAVFNRFQQNDGGYVRADNRGYQILLNFRGASGSFQTVSITDVLENRIPPDFLQDRIVLIGPTASSLEDAFYNPYSTDDLTALYGLEIHAHLVSQIVSAALDERHLIRVLPDPIEWLWILGWSWGSAVLSAMCLRKRWTVVSVVLLGACLVILSYEAFIAGWWIPVFTPLLAVAGSAISSTSCILWKNIKLSHQQLEEYARTLEQKVEERAEQLRLSEEKFAKVFRATPCPIVIVSVDEGKYININQSFLKATGYTSEEILDRPFGELDLWVNAQHPSVSIDDFTRQGGVNNHELRFRTKKGEERTALFSTEAVNLRGQNCLLVIFNDITDRKRAEAALEAANHKLHRIATMDSLTQVANRRRFDEYLNQEWQRMSRERAPLSLILCDVDDFKRYNDTYGHQAGDVCLHQIAQAIRRALKRPADLVARYGGEEFAAILPNTPASGAMQVARAIREEIWKLAIPHTASRVSDLVTVSLGVTTQIPILTRPVEFLIAASDRALYEAKARGRNCAVARPA